MISGHEVHASKLVDEVEELLHARVTLLARNDGRLEVTSVTDHIRIGVIDTHDIILATAKSLLTCGGDFTRFHERRLVEGNVVAGNLNVGFEILVEISRAVAIPEEGDVTKLLCLAACEGLEPIRREDFTGSALDKGRGNKVVGRELEVPVVLHEPSEFDLRKADAVETLEVGILKSLGDFDDAISTEVSNHNCIVILDGADGLAVIIYDDERFEVLIAVTALLQLLETLDGVGELVGGLAKDVSLPTPFDHGPVGLVTVHGNLHPSTARRNLGITTLKGSEVVHKGRHVLAAGSVGNIAPVGENVQAKLLAAVSHSALHQALELIVPRVHTARAQQSDDVQSVRLESGFDVLPASVLEDGFLFEGNINEGCTLSDDLSGTERVVADLSKRGLEKVTFWGEEKTFSGKDRDRAAHLAVPHVLVGRQADGRTVS